MRFLRHHGIYRSDVGQVKPSGSLGRGAASRWSAPGQAKERDGRSALCSSSTMSSGRLILDRVARQQSPSPLHRQPDHKMLDESKRTIYHRTVISVLTGCLTSGAHPNRAVEDWFRAVPTSKVVAIHQEPLECQQRARRAIGRHMDPTQGKFVWIDKWIQNCAWSNVLSKMVAVQ